MTAPCGRWLNNAAETHNQPFSDEGKWADVEFKGRKDPAEIRSPFIASTSTLNLDRHLQQPFDFSRTAPPRWPSGGSTGGIKAVVMRRFWRLVSALGLTYPFLYSVPGFVMSFIGDI